MSNTSLVTIDDLQKTFPSKAKLFNDELVEIINKSKTEPEFQGESLLETMVTYENLFSKHKGISMQQYVDAIRFCAYLVSMDDNYTEAYKKTFRRREFVSSRWDAPTNSEDYRALTSAACRYRKNRIVIDILTLSQVPLELMFTGYRYRAVAVLADEMENAKYSKDRIAAAKELLAATKGADELKIDIGVSEVDNSAIRQLNDQLASMAARQKAMLEGGLATLEDYGSMKAGDRVVEAEYEEVTNEQ